MSLKLARNHRRAGGPVRLQNMLQARHATLLLREPTNGYGRTRAAAKRWTPPLFREPLRCGGHSLCIHEHAKRVRSAWKS